jgi:4-diphosphocytidyl-2-C-methyl-D-erythritol kinase
MTAGGRVVAQAKLNLFLRILEREASGYHQIETLFCRLELGDVVTVRPTASDRALTVSGPALPVRGLGAPERNLAWRAADAFALRAGWPRGFTIDIEKNIPVGGGLGGGSADAGAVLRILNALCPVPLPRAALLSVAESIGADVPFLTTEDALALAWGRGEQLTPFPPLPPRDVSLVCFDEGVPTADAYRWLDETRGGPTTGFHRSGAVPVKILSWDQVASLARNDFEAVVLSRYPRIKQHLAAARAPAFRARFGDRTIALLSGTGATVFIIPEKTRDAVLIATQAGEHVQQTRTAVRVAAVERVD